MVRARDSERGEERDGVDPEEIERLVGDGDDREEMLDNLEALADQLRD